MKDKKQGTLNGWITAGKILLFLMLAFNIFVLIVYGMIVKSDPLEGISIQYVKDWDVTNGENGDQTISARLPEKIQDNEYLFFETRNDAAVYINGKLRKDFVEKRDVNVPGGSLKRFIMSVPLMAEDSGGELVIERKAVQKIDKEINEMFIATRYSALGHFLKSNGSSFLLSFIIMIFSFVAFVVSIVLRVMYKQKIDMTYGALGIFLIAAWLISDSYLFPIIIGADHVGGLMNFFFCLMMPLALGAYLFAVQRGRYKKSMSVLMILSILNATIWPVFHFTGFIPFYKLRDLANATLVVLAAAGIAILIADAIKKNTSEYRYTFIGFLGFFIGCIIALFEVILNVGFKAQTVPMVFGLGFLLTFLVIQQVNDLRKINMEKQRAIDISEAKTRFLASMSHEIRTPINAILGMNEMILRENNDKAIEEYSRNIKSSGKMLLMLVNDVLDFSKIEAGKLEIRDNDFLMSDMLYDVISLVKERAEEKNLNLTAEITSEVPNSVRSDEFRIRQILVNIMNNAVKYTEEGTVTLKVGGSYTEDGYNLDLVIKDTGKGIRKEDQEYLFEAFSRADVKSNANIEGTGLGLAIVKSIVDSMHGEIGVESEYGVGSEFRVMLPIKYNDKEPLRSDFMDHRVEKETTKAESSFIAPDAKVLAVDDNQSNLTIVKLFLKKNGIVPDLCKSGSRAIELCKENKYDLILLDHMMPSPDGIETLQVIRTDAASLNKETKAVVLTANAVAGSRQMYMNAGFDDYLTKPLDSDILEETVKKMLPADKVKDAKTISEPATVSVKSAAKAVGASLTKNGRNGDGVVFDTGLENIEAVNMDAASLRDRLSKLKGMDYEAALKYCGGEESLLQEIIGDISREGAERAERMKKSLEAQDIRAYEIEAHTIKSSMATIGLQDFSDRAREHEFAAKESNNEFISENAEGFVSDYLELCNKLSECIG